MHFETQDLINRLVLYFIPMIFSLSLHEYGHAATAVALGDQTPREQGRLTLNPVVHLDLLGTILVPLACLFAGQPPMGWAKPVQSTPYRFTRKVHMKTAVMLVAAAGPAMNFVLAVVMALALAASTHFGHVPGGPRATALMEQALQLNVVLFLFNLLPVPPLDGSRVLSGLLPYALRRGWVQLERFSPMFLGILFFTGVGGHLLRQPSFLLSDALDRFGRFLFP